MDRLPENVGVVIVDHGSIMAEANDMLLDVARMFAESTQTAIVEPAHMELASPSIAEAIDRCVSRGADTIVIHPYFLSPGRHSKQDIPRMAEEAGSSKNIKVLISDPLGLEPRLIEVAQRRILERWNQEQPDRPPVTQSGANDVPTH
jgi:sirohydrochlorin ferrochelatase